MGSRRQARNAVHTLSDSNSVENTKAEPKLQIRVLFSISRSFFACFHIEEERNEEVDIHGHAARTHTQVITVTVSYKYFGVYRDVMAHPQDHKDFAKLDSW